MKVKLEASASLQEYYDVQLYTRQIRHSCKNYQKLEITRCHTLFYGHFSKSIITAKSLLFEDWLIVEVSEGACISAALPLKLRQR